MLVGISVLLMIVYAAPFLGLPELIAQAPRLCSTEQLFILAVVVIPVDLAAGAIALTPGRRVLPLALAAGSGGDLCGDETAWHFSRIPLL